MANVIVGKHEFYTGLRRSELDRRLRGEPGGRQEVGVDVSFGGKLMVNIAEPDEAQILVWPPDVSAVWGGLP